MQDAPAKLCSSFALVNKSNYIGPVSIAIYYPDKTDKIDRLIHVPGSKMAVKTSSGFGSLDSDHVSKISGFGY